MLRYIQYGCNSWVAQSWKKMKSTRQFSGFLLILILINIISQINSQANEVIGCGGFIKSHAEIDFSKVEIKL